MKLKNNRSGFTLLEIIIVIIIVGVLASLALPRFSGMINKSKATEALNALGVAKRAADTCLMEAQAYNTSADMQSCDTWGEIGMDDPGTVAGANFAYAMTAHAAAANTFHILASLNGGAGDEIEFTYDTAGGAVTRTGRGVFASIK